MLFCQLKAGFVLQHFLLAYIFFCSILPWPNLSPHLLYHNWNYDYDNYIYNISFQVYVWWLKYISKQYQTQIKRNFHQMFIKSGNFKITFSPWLIKFEMGVGTCENGWELKSWSYSDVVGEERCGWVGGVERRGKTFITDITDLSLMLCLK